MTLPTAVVVAFGALKPLEDCLASLDNAVSETIVVDNGSSDEARAIVERHLCRYVDPGANLGYAAAVNLALRLTNSDSHVLLVNPDAILPPGAVIALQAPLMTEDRVAVTAPLLRGESGEAQRPSWPVPTPTGVWLDAAGLGRYGLSRPRFLTGAVLMLNRRALQEIGEFDERYFLYAEEADWQLRALRAGWNLRLVSDVTATHIGGATSNDPRRREVLFYRSAEAFGRKWYGERGWQVMRAGSIAGAALRATTRRGESQREARRLLALYIEGGKSD